MGPHVKFLQCLEAELQKLKDVVHCVTLHKNFIKDLGPFHYSFGYTNCAKTRRHISVTEQYFPDLLTKSEMLLSKPCATPCLPYNILLMDDGKPYNNPSLYRSLVEAL